MDTFYKTYSFCKSGHLQIDRNREPMRPILKLTDKIKKEQTTNTHVENGGMNDT